MPPDEQHERLTKKVEAELGDLAREGDRLENEIEQVRAQWRAKQADPSVPGAVSPETDEDAPESDDANAASGQSDANAASGQSDDANAASGQSDDEDASADHRDRRSST
jgi:hypothetical protein